jgi:hypothetical protein
MVMKKEAYASLVVFMLYGVAGWWTMLTNYRKFNSADIYGLMTLAQRRAKVLLESKNSSNIESASSKIESSHPILCGSWGYLNSYIIRLILRTDFNSARPSWESSMKAWNNDLNPAHISRLVTDVHLEIRTPGISMMPAGGAAPPVTLGSKGLGKTMDNLIKMLNETLNPGEIQKEEEEEDMLE